MGNTIILRVQAKSTKESELLSVDGNRIETSNDDFYALSSQTINVRDCKKIIGEEVLKVYKSSDKRIIIHSNFMEKDVVGRRIAFTSSVAKEESNDVVECLQTEAAIYGYSLCPKDVERIKKALDEKPPFQIIAILIVGMVILTLIISGILKK